MLVYNYHMYACSSNYLTLKLFTYEYRKVRAFELQVEQFKQFLLAQGIHNNTVNLLQISK